MSVEERVALEEAALKWMQANNAGIKKAVHASNARARAGSSYPCT